MNESAIALYSRVSLNRDFPEYNLKRGDIATFIDTVPDPDDVEEGYILEVFNALGESIDVVTVPKSAVSALQPDEIPTVRSLSQPAPSSSSYIYPGPLGRRVIVARYRYVKPQKKGKSQKNRFKRR